MLLRGLEANVSGALDEARHLGWISAEDAPSARQMSLVSAEPASPPAEALEAEPCEPAGSAASAARAASVVSHAAKSYPAVGETVHAGIAVLFIVYGWFGPVETDDELHKGIAYVNL